MCECSVVKGLQQFLHEFTVTESVENTVDDFNRPAKEVRLEKVRANDITQLLDTNGQQFYNEDMEGIVKELSEQKKEEEKE